ncbi:MAG: adenosylcobinamide amidohydrolase [Arenicella sp.]|nr:adenosylcobinamide amidohydrolase [Arenicella sp.]
MNLSFLACTLVALVWLEAADAEPIKPRPSPLPTNALSTVLHANSHFIAQRQGRYFFVDLKQAHRVFSTSSVNGGQADDVTTLVNFQSMEATGHDDRFTEILSLSDVAYHQQVASQLQRAPETMTLMGTAANINHTVHVQQQFRDITVDAFVTAGVKGNALRAGDTANWYQGKTGNERINADLTIRSTDNPEAENHHNHHGTINIMVFVNRALSAGAQAKAIAILTEAKSAALTELAISSTRSQHLATGTGTDQYSIATPLDATLPALSSASGHLKLGELLGTAVREAVLQALHLQNGLAASATRNIHHALTRFGFKQDVFMSQLASALSAKSLQLLQKNKQSLLTEPKLVAAAYAYAAVLDRLEYGSLSQHIAIDILLDQAVNASLAVSGHSAQWPHFRRQLQQYRKKGIEPVAFFTQAIAIGWEDKWR